MAKAARRQSVAFRFDRGVVDHLRQRASDTGAAQTELAQRYIEEGLRRDEHPLIYFRAGEAGRRPALLGSRLDVASVVSTVRQNDDSVDGAAEYLELPAEQVVAALSYYAAFKDEVDRWAERVEALAERERARWRDRHDALS